jgi:NAD(P)-dependent dehydrogenase (short-subunit alcohol dehydrogenase family)
MGQELSDDVAIVTGTGRGIGRTIPLSRAAAGAVVGVCARTEQEIGETTGLIINGHPGGVSGPTIFRAAARRTILAGCVIASHQRC